MDRYGLAVDLGSTTIGYAVVDRESGKRIKEGITENPGRAYGRDILSRIRAYSVGADRRITSAMREAVAGLLDAAGENGFPPPGPEGEKASHSLEPVSAVISGNTTMNHMLLGLDAGGLAAAPYTPVTLKGGELCIDTVWGTLCARTLPGFSSFVGGDIVSGIRALDMDASQKTCLLIDLGTNGEMVLGGRDGFYVTSVAAGPAFEEWGLTHGMYGSRVIDICHRLVRTGIIKKDGAFSDESMAEGGFPISGQGREAVILSQDDVRDIQLAKAAVRAGIELLLKRASKSCDDIERVYIAGGMGEHLSIDSAFGIGMLPEELSGERGGLPRVTAVGNTSLKGAVEELLHPDPARLEAITRMGTPLLLSDEPDFNDTFVSYMDF